MFRKIVNRIFIVFVKRPNDAIIDELAVIEVIVDECRVDGQV
jgi:hypothetical protein